MNKYPMQFGRYLLINKIASGGMAEIFKAKLQGVEGFEKTVAIKRILPFWSEDRNFITMLVDEAKVLVHLNHPNIVQVYELGRVDQIYFIAMEFIEGLDLRSFTQFLPSSLDEKSQHVILTMMLEVLEGLQYAHNRYLASEKALGVIHRDISPQNILVSLQGEIKVTDFGIAKAVTQTHETQTGVLKGKFSYMSPEQAMGQTLDKRSDLFSWGIVCFEMLFRQRPFQGKTDIETIDKIRKAELDWPEFTSQKLFPGVKEILNRVLAKNSEDRFQDAQEIIESLEALLPGKRRLNQMQLSTYFNEQLSLKNKLSKQEELNLGKHNKTLPLEKTPSSEQTVSLVQADLEDLFSEEKDFVSSQGFSGSTQEKQFKLEPSSKFFQKNDFSWKKMFMALTSLIFIIAGVFFSPQIIAYISKFQNHTGNTESSELQKKEGHSEERINAVQNPPQWPFEYASNMESVINQQVEKFPVTLELSVSPMNGKLVAQFPGGSKSAIGKLVLPPLKAGTSVQVMASLSGYETKQKKITLSGQEGRVKESLSLIKEEPKFGRLSVNSAPVWGKVFVGKLVTDVPTPLKSRRLAVGTYPVTVKSADGQMKVSGSARVRAGHHTVCQANFKNVPRIQCN